MPSDPSSSLKKGEKLVDFVYDVRISFNNRKASVTLDGSLL